MAHRPNPEEFDRPLTPQQIAERRQQLAKLSPAHVADAYRQAYEKCRMDSDRVPRASAVQDLVTIWKLLWRWKRRRPPRRD
jgi:hypothetical protein